MKVAENFQLDEKILNIPKRTGDPRIAHLLNFDDAQVYIGGYPDDEGIANNGGRIGAKEGPNEILKHFLKMTPPAFSDFSLPEIRVLGTQKPSLNDLFERLELGKKCVSSVLSSDKIWIGLGGGHDYGYSEGAGFLEQYQDKNPLVVNFDAHLDVRSFEKSKISSGTPFSRLLTDYANSFEFIEIGVQEYCNSKEHAKWVVEQGGRIVTLSEVRSAQSPLDIVKKHIQPDLTRPCFLSVDIDVFSSSFAMGCSQAWPTGLTPIEFWPVFQWLCQNFSTRTLGVYEVSPPLDLDNRTAKLAAEIVYEFVLHTKKEN